ncbi:MAG TPA: AmmeMemoRadiSam system protein A [Vicinamibacteria bacterium]|nr:AmmeMemoRadiSam system protein A [Vicinamibacteria bacterium]
MSAPTGLQQTEAPSAEEQAVLLRVAREAIRCRLQRARLVLPAATGALAEPRGAFVTLRRRTDGELRGCIGNMVSEGPLLETVSRMAVAAATEDPRFPPLGPEELDEVTIEVSALGPLTPIRPEQVEVGRHGLLLSDGRRRGVLLPQVPLEHGWDRETFLAHTCWKAGLPEDAWRRPEVEILAFTACVFAEP